MAERREPAQGPGPCPGLRGQKERRLRPGGQRRHPLPDDRRFRRGQNGIFPVSEFGVCLCQRYEFPGSGYERRPGAELRGHRYEALRLQGGGH